MSTKFFNACRSGNIPKALNELELLESIDLQDEKGRTGLSLALRNSNIELAHKLVERGASVHIVNNNGTTIFMYAKTPLFDTSTSDDYEILTWLLGLGAELNAVDIHGLTVLDYVIAHGDTRLTNWLKQRGAVAIKSD